MKTKMLISYAVTAELVCDFVFHIIQEPGFSHDAPQILLQ